MTPTDLYIGGEWRTAEHGDQFPVINPASGDEVEQVAAGTPADAIAACDAAALAQQAWAGEAPRTRSEILRACWQILVDHTDELAERLVEALSNIPVEKLKVRRWSDYKI